MSVDQIGIVRQNPSSAAPSPPASAGSSATTVQAATSDPLKFGVFGARKAAKSLAENNADLQRRLLEQTERAERAETQLRAVGGMELADVQAEISRQRAGLAAETKNHQAQLLSIQQRTADAEARARDVEQRVVRLTDTEILQEVGVYEYSHPLDDAVAFQAELKRLQGRIKDMARADGGAVHGATDWTVNGSVVQGRKMVRETSKLMLRAYNAEADSLVRSLKPYKLEAAVSRLGKTYDVISRLGATMSIRIDPSYHRLRTEELHLTADYLEKKAEEKERERAERERLREEAKVQQEMERERQRLEKEKTHYENALAKLLQAGDAASAERLRDQLSDIERAIADVDYRAANIRAGYVYVISNIGSFGPDVVKIGLTRRLDPHDRVRELGDASVPFRFDVHALHFSEDAVGVETDLHRRFADRRLNTVNLRREFFRVTPTEVKTAMAEMAGNVLEWTDEPEALEYRQSSSTKAGGPGVGTGPATPVGPSG